MKRILCGLALLLTVVSARADEPSRLVLEVRAQRVPHDQLADALRSELAGEGEGDAAQGELSLTEPSDDVVRITYRDALGNTASRDLKIAQDDPEALEKVTLAAINLVRDQSRGLLAELAQENLKVVPQTPETEKPPPVVLEEPERASPKARYNPCKGGETLILGGDFVPLLGTSSTRAGRESKRHASINMFGSYSAGVQGAELSMGINIDRRGTCGAQVAPFANLTLGPTYGAQLSITNITWGDLHGAQLGVANIAWGNALGVQIGVGNLSWGNTWLQAGVANFAHGTTGAQLGVANIAVGGVRGAQLGVANVSGGDTKGFQLGAANITAGQARIQLGVFNYARRSKASVGVVSIVAEGRTSLEFWTTENGTTLFGLRHGSKGVHNTFGAGFRFGPKGTRIAQVFGIGSRLVDRPRHTWDLDALFETLARADYYEVASVSSRLRITGTWKINDTYGLFAAPGYVLMTTMTEEESTQSPFGQTVFSHDPVAGKSGEGKTTGFPSLSIGLRVRLGGEL